MRTIGLFGGTFDPIHIGHLRMALELKQSLALDEMRLLPCHKPPHRDEPGCSADQRAAMVKLAVNECQDLSVDLRELNRQTASYTVDTLAELRRDLSDQVSLCWCIGMDSLATLDSWYHWRQLTEYCHLVVVGRPGWHAPESGELGDWVRQRVRQPGYICEHSHGSIVIQEQTLLPISSTHIREEVGAQRNPQFLLPDPVWRYIKDNNLYNREDTDN